MNKTLLIVIVVAAALALGIGGAYAVSLALPGPTTLSTGIDTDTAPDADEYRWPDWMGRDGGRMGARGRFGNRCDLQGVPDRCGGWSGGWGNRMPGRMTPFQRVSPWGCSEDVTGERISIDEALAQAEDYAAQIGDNLQVSEVMEFSRNFYAILIETDSGMGAMELLIDPYTGRVTPEIGPNMMWNDKYGHMRRLTDSTANALSLDEAAAAAQEALDEQIPGAELETDGTEFYGYFSFDYSVEGEVAGMLSVNGKDGRVWLHTWHGEFIGKKEIES